MLEKLTAFRCHSNWASPAGGRQQDDRGNRALPVRRDRTPPAKQGKRQKYIDVLSLDRQSLQNKQCFHNLYAYLSAARNNRLHVCMFARVLWSMMSKS
jgi:hypothetical protein